jgi:hypothetical protein
MARVPYTLFEAASETRRRSEKMAFKPPFNDRSIRAIALDVEGISLW